MQPEQDIFLEILFREHYHALLLYAYAFVKDHSESQVAVQEGFRIACSKIDEVMAAPNPVGWMKQTIKYVSLNMVKRKKRQMLLFVSLEETIHSQQDSQEKLTELLDLCAGAVSKQEFALYRRVVLEGLPYSEAAKELGVSLGACYKRLERIESRLRAALEKELGGS